MLYCSLKDSIHKEDDASSVVLQNYTGTQSFAIRQTNQYLCPLSNTLKITLQAYKAVHCKSLKRFG